MQNNKEMRVKALIRTSIFASIMLFSCRSNYEVTGFEAKRIEITNRLDAKINKEAEAILAPYREQVEKEMNTVIGESEIFMTSHHPQSLLSNFVADVLYEEALQYDSQVSFAVINTGGLRAGMPKGNVTIKNIFEITPFENTLTIVELTGEQIMMLMQNLAQVNGEGISNRLQLVISKTRTVVSAKIDGKDIIPSATYKVATLDYLAEGNDKLVAFKLSKNVNKPEGATIRQLTINHIKQKTREGKKLTSKLDNRLTVAE